MPLFASHFLFKPIGNLGFVDQPLISRLNSWKSIVRVNKFIDGIPAHMQQLGGFHWGNDVPYRGGLFFHSIKSFLKCLVKF